MPVSTAPPAVDGTATYLPLYGSQLAQGRSDMRARRVLIGAVAAILSFAAVGTIASAGGGCAPEDSTHTRATGTAVSITGCKFAPVVLPAPAGATITWTHRDQYPPHNVYGLGWGMSMGRLLEQGGTYTSTFNKPGIYPYQCSLHPGMSGVVIVGDGQLADTGVIPQIAATTAAPREAPLIAGSAASGRDGRIAVILATAGIVASALLAYLLGRRRAIG